MGTLGAISIRASCLQPVLAYIRTSLSKRHMYFVMRTAAESWKLPSAPAVPWTLMSRKQFAGLGLWIPLLIDDTGINLFLPAHLWKIHACSKYLSPWMRVGGCMSTSRTILVKGWIFFNLLHNGFILLPKQKERKTLALPKSIGKLWLKIMPILRLLLSADTDELRWVCGLLVCFSEIQWLCVLHHLEVNEVHRSQLDS